MSLFSAVAGQAPGGQMQQNLDAAQKAYNENPYGRTKPTSSSTTSQTEGFNRSAVGMMGGLMGGGGNTPQKSDVTHQIMPVGQAQVMPAPPQTAMNPAPGPYSPFGNNPLQVTPPTLPGPPGTDAGGGGVRGPRGGGSVSGPEAPTYNWQAQGPNAVNEYGGQRIAGNRAGAADYNSVQSHTDAAYQQARRHLDPQQTQQNERMAQDLINKGIDPNSEQGQRMQAQLGRQQADANNAAAFGAMQFGQGIQQQMHGQAMDRSRLAGQMQQALWQQQGQADQRNLQFGLGQMQNQLGYAGLGNQANIASMQNRLGYAGLENQANIASMQDKTNRLNAQNNYNLGMAGIENSRYGMDLQNQQAMGQLDLARQGQDFNQMMGLDAADFRNQQFGFQQDQYMDQLTMAMMGMTPVPGANPIDPSSAFGTTIGSAGSNQGFLGRVFGF